MNRLDSVIGTSVKNDRIRRIGAKITVDTADTDESRLCFHMVGEEIVVFRSSAGSFLGLR